MQLLKTVAKLVKNTPNYEQYKYVVITLPTINIVTFCMSFNELDEQYEKCGIIPISALKHYLPLEERDRRAFVKRQLEKWPNVDQYTYLYAEAKTGKVIQLYKTLQELTNDSDCAEYLQLVSYTISDVMDESINGYYTDRKEK